jgi:hypothetical protein
VAEASWKRDRFDVQRVHGEDRRDERAAPDRAGEPLQRREDQHR